MIFEEIGSLFVNVAALSDWRYWVMWAIGGLLIYLAIAKDMTEQVEGSVAQKASQPFRKATGRQPASFSHVY